MKTRVSWVLAGVVGIQLSANPVPAETAESVMGKSDCLACHASNERRVGPSFNEIASKYAGQASALETLTRAVLKGSSGTWGAIAMPPHSALDEFEARAMIEWILKQGDSGSAIAAANPQPSYQPTLEHVSEGRALFTGEKRLANRGPSCLSCHSVSGVTAFGGGTLAVDLTGALTRLGGADALIASLKRPAFPVMKEIFKAHPITESEAQMLASYLWDQVGKRENMPPARRFESYALVGFFLVFGLMNIVWFRRIRPVRKRLVKES